ncbi:MAG: hypothetical protein KKG59_03285 [Nanoarchaeota archaeon]|nr:hypothetical protein [Nanoarchaeota archaeon]
MKRQFHILILAIAVIPWIMNGNFELLSTLFHIIIPISLVLLAESFFAWKKELKLWKPLFFFANLFMVGACVLIAFRINRVNYLDYITMFSLYTITGAFILAHAKQYRKSKYWRTLYGSTLLSIIGIIILLTIVF